MGSTLAGPVPIVVGAAVAVPLTYAYDIVVRGLSFTTLSLVGAVVVFISFLLLNILELHTSSAVTTEQEEAERRRRQHQNESNRLLEASPNSMLTGYLTMPPSLPGEQREARGGTQEPLLLN